MDQDEIGLTNLVAENEGLEVPDQTSAETQKDTETSETETKTNTEEEPKAPENKSAEAQTEVAEPPAETDTKDPAKAETEATDDTKSEPLQEESSTEQKPDTEVVNDWKATLAPPPTPVPLVEPQVNEAGQIVNMNPQQYEDYLIQKAENRLQERQYANYVENAALDAAEKILPEIKTKPEIRQLLENQRVAQVVNGKEGDAVTAALTLKSLLGNSQEQLATATAQAKAEGAQNAKTSITIQKNAAVETGGNQQTTEATKSEKLSRRVNAGDPDAVVELLSMWEENGSLSQ